MNNNIVIGKHTLESLTSGMYSDPYVVFREYIQNAADSIDDAYKAKLLTKGNDRINISVSPLERLIVIEDNGAIDNDTLEQLKHNICETSGVVTGLINVSRRLNRYAGDKQRFKLERSELSGLSVTIILDCLGETDV